MSSSRDRLMDLLTDRALVGLGQREQIELAELLLQVQDVDINAFDAAASAIALATIGQDIHSRGALAPLPSSLAETVEQSALALLDAQGPSGTRPASDYMKTREIEKLAPGALQTQIDPTFLPPPESIAPISEEDANDFKRTLVIENTAPPPAKPVSVLTSPTIAQPRDPYLFDDTTARRSGAPATPAAPAPRAQQASQQQQQRPAQPLASPAPAPVQPSAQQRQPSGPMLAQARPSFGPPQAPPSYPRSSQPASSHPSQPVYGSGPVSNVVPFAPRGPSRAVAISGWIAAAACLALAIGAYVLKTPSDPIAIRVPPITTAPTNVPVPSVAPAPSQTPAQLREALLAAQGSARAEWSPTKDPLGKTATGEVVWNKDQQRGTMRFRGLAKNDPKQGQYQLWIFDKTRDDKYPVDGGVFDVDSETGDVVVPIRATLPVSAPVLFAVTLEKPGGVVVSKRDRIVVTAKMPTG